MTQPYADSTFSYEELLSLNLSVDTTTRRTSIMASTLAQSNPDPEDADYKSSEDSDFDPTTGGGGADDDAASSASEAEDADSISKPTTGKKGKKRKGETEAEDLGFENSGDEATIRRGKKKKKRKGDEEVEDEEGGEGGVVKTRSMRAVE